MLIVGAGLAGLFLALKCAPRKVIVLSPAPLGKAASSTWAQGGLAAALSPTDSPEAHAKDTEAAGAGLVDPIVARLIAEDGPRRVRDLITLGVPFDRTPNGDLALSLEAAHSHPRVARVQGDLAGRAIMQALVDATRAAGHIEIIEGRAAIALTATDRGVGGVLTEDASGVRHALAARETVLCTGGVGGLFRVTTNPTVARGDALAMAGALGALIADPEFVQFHPTAIDIGRDPAPLATEALRGDGAVLRNRDGRAFMADYDPRADLASRDMVARAIHSEIQAGRGALLDATDAVGAHFPDAFPTVFTACQSAGIDPRTEPIPVAPAAHYHMGGLMVDIWGRTTLEGLSACGECASTGAHGANRLASNSLLEAVVFAARIAERLQGSDLGKAQPGFARPFPVLPDTAFQSLRVAMSSLCGVVRDAQGLGELGEKIKSLAETHGWTRELLAADWMCAAAGQRTESRGGHFRDDYPDARAPERTFLSPSRNSHHTTAQAAE